MISEDRKIDLVGTRRYGFILLLHIVFYTFCSGIIVKIIFHYVVGVVSDWQATIFAFCIAWYIAGIGKREFDLKINEIINERFKQ